MRAKKRVRIIKKIRDAAGVWRFISLSRIGNRYVWDKLPGYYYLDWREGPRRRRELAGRTPAEAIEAQRRKTNELIGELVGNGKALVPDKDQLTVTPIADAVRMFTDHVEVHSPDKPKTVQRYGKVLQHFERILGKKRFVEAFTRADIDDFKTTRGKETSEQHKGRPITARTINFEVSVLRTFFYFLINERGLSLANPCARYKLLKDARAKGRSKPPTYSREENEKLFKVSDDFEKTILSTLLYTGLREQELCFLTWPDIDLGGNNIRVAAKPAEGFSPKDYEERLIPIPPELANTLSRLRRNSKWVFPTSAGNRITHLLRRLKDIAGRAGIENATLHSSAIPTPRGCWRMERIS